MRPQLGLKQDQEPGHTSKGYRTHMRYVFILLLGPKIITCFHFLITTLAMRLEYLLSMPLPQCLKSCVCQFTSSLTLLVWCILYSTQHCKNIANSWRTGNLLIIF